MQLTPPMRVFFGTIALKSPFEKGDLGGFSSAYEIPPDPPLKRGVEEQARYIFTLNPSGSMECNPEVHLIGGYSPSG